ncbi:N-term cysteine-rich ER, FAM69 [Dermatophagoides farinae]|uniref:N-term cysteine-rich ER, FAM69 n=1 Tax=Dermatophagoides farinae TaxID=6954 RepID=A0A922I9R3_DERFA|nr:N-term cysteine-rich ER, FAM69 [Dermatophagoides farinae]
MKIEKSGRYLIALFLVFILVTNEFREWNTNSEDGYAGGCDYIIDETYVQICTNYKKNIFFGNLCPQLCDTSYDDYQIKLIDCPSSASHIGKDVVIFAEKLPNGIQNDIIGLSNVSLGQDLFSEDQLNDTNHYLLIKQHEYVLAKLFNDDYLYPKILYTCGHFYAVPKLNNIIDWTYLLPFPLQTSNDKIIVAIDLLNFLKRFINTKLPMELCDVKYYHFGYNENGTLLLLDSDLIQSRHSLIDIIEHVTDCKIDDDCHFIDCHGKCHQGSCLLDMTDNNLKRICRNILFVGKLYSLLNMGLLAMPWSLLKNDEISIQQFYRLCFDVDHQNLNYIIKEMEKILSNLLMHE